MGILKTIGKVILVIGLAVSAFGGFLCGSSLMNPQAGLGALAGFLVGLMLIIYIGIPAMFLGLVVYLVGRWLAKRG